MIGVFTTFRREVSDQNEQILRCVRFCVTGVEMRFEHYSDLWLQEHVPAHMMLIIMGVVRMKVIRMVMWIVLSITTRTTVNR